MRGDRSGDATWWNASAAIACASIVVACASAAPVEERQPVRPESPRPENPIATHLRGAECQIETAEQRANVRTALDDLATLPPEKLRERRYANYAGQAGQWDLRMVLMRHLVPVEVREMPEREAFWQATDSDEVRRLADAACR